MKSEEANADDFAPASKEEALSRELKAYNQSMEGHIRAMNKSYRKAKRLVGMSQLWHPYTSDESDQACSWLHHVEASNDPER